jgi:3-hydroxyisobutyrate dehydrogenase-like beta-hydroxyacid dehydrogenase
VPPAFAKDMAARCAEADVHYLDAPISGGSVKAANGQLSIMASGTQDAFAAAQPLLDIIAETVFELGD